MFLYRDTELELQQLEPRHAEELFAIIDANRDHLREWLQWVDATRSADDTRAFIERSLHFFAEQRALEGLGIRKDGRLVGAAGFGYIDWENRRTEIGYWLSADVQGKGLMTRTCRVLITYAFEDLSMNKVEIHCAPGNRKSRAIPERLGFREEGVIRQSARLYDQFVDHVVYGMLASEWQSV